MTKQNNIELVKLLEEKQRRRKQNLCLAWFNAFYPWQFDACAATKDYFEVCLMCANQVGKTITGDVIDAMHLLGDYPENWPGHKFKKPPLCWALGYSMEKTRDLLQSALFGNYNNETGFEGGLVPKDRIVSKESAMGVQNAMRTVRVKHKSGGISTMQFWSYTQGQHAIMGDVVDWFHVDEEPKDQKIRPQVLTRTINGDSGKGGRGIYTFTPENGRTDLVIQFMDNPSKDQFFMQKGWVDAPHMTEEKRDRLLAQYPEHQREMRSTGSPMLGHGRIYDLADEFVLCDPFEIPSFWKTICGNDFGWDHPQALAKISHDLENDIIYVTNSWKASKVSANDAWGATHNWSGGYPVAWPHDGLQKEKARDDSVQIKNHYTDAGFKMLFNHATWLEGGFSVEAGIYAIIDRARKGKFKIFKGQPDLMEEWRQYHRDDNGNIVKLRDDILCAIRYAIMMIRFAIYNGDNLNIKKAVKMPRPVSSLGVGK